MSDIDNIDIRVRGPQVRKRYGGISEMTLHRWKNDPNLGFPSPILVNGRSYWRVSDLEKWERAHVARRLEKKPPAKAERATRREAS